MFPVFYMQNDVFNMYSLLLLYYIYESKNMISNLFEILKKTYVFWNKASKHKKGLSMIILISSNTKG